MPIYRVVNRYRDRATGERVEPETLVTLSPRTGQRMVARGLVVSVDRQTTPETATRQPAENAARRTAEPKHTGGGWYLLPSGEKVQGKNAAIERMQES